MSFARSCSVFHFGLVLFVLMGKLQPLDAELESQESENPVTVTCEQTANQQFWSNFGETFYSQTFQMNSPVYDLFMPILAANVSQQTVLNASLQPQVNSTEVEQVLSTTSLGFNTTRSFGAPPDVAGTRRRRRRQGKHIFHV